jgi:hypothetical protein
MRYGVQVPIAEEIVQELGEDTAWQIAREKAASAVRDTVWQDLPHTEESLPQNVTGTDPETGAALPPIRLYRFTYRLGGDEPAPPDGYLDRSP